MVDQKLMTKKGLFDLKKKLAGLEARRPKAIRRVEAARQMGDLRENSEYHAAREDLVLLETQIDDLKMALTNVVVADNSARIGCQAGLGSLVTIKNGGQEITYQLVGENESNPLEKKISYTSPLGQALMDRRVGDKVMAKTPGGQVEYQIMAIK